MAEETVVTPKTETFELPVDDKGVPFIPDNLMDRFGPVVDRLVKPRLDKERARVEKELASRRVENNPADQEKLKTLEEQVRRFEIEDLERKKNYDKAEELRAEREKKRDADHRKELDDREKEIARRDGRLKEMARSEIKIAAKKLGARDESLDELAEILGGKIDLDADLQPFVKGPDGKPLEKDGAVVSIEGLVGGYLDTKPHHRAGAGGTGGGARGGATYSGPDARRAEELQAELEQAEKVYRANRSDLNALARIGKAKGELAKLKTA